MTAAVADGRKERNRHQLSLLARWCATMLALPALVIMMIVAAASGNIALAIGAALATWVAVSAVAFRQVRRFGSVLVASLPAGTANDESLARLHNLTEGLCVAHGVAKPVIHVVDLASSNAATVLLGEHDREVALVVTAGLVEALSRIELEGLIAQQLSHVRDGDVALATFVAALASVPVLGPLLGRRAGSCLDPHLETVADLAGASMTRYPPGLASALSRLRDQPNEVPQVPATAAHLWVADPLAPGATEPFVPHPPLADRIEVLSEL